MKVHLPNLVTARITHLEMERPHAVHVPPPVGLQMAIMRTHHIPLHFYRYLYEQIGRAHHWVSRRGLSDEGLSAIIHDDKTDIYILYVDGCPAGFSELNRRAAPDYVEIVYFGLVPDYQQRGLSSFFFHDIVDAAWSHGSNKLIIQTNTLDNPRALQLYQKFGFSPVRYSEATIEAWN